MRRQDFNYTLPERLIARYPLPERSASRLMELAGDRIRHCCFRNLPDLLRPGDRLVFNDTKVIPARLTGRKDSGGRVEMLVERLLGARRLMVQLKASRTPKIGSRLLVGSHTLMVSERRADLFVLDVDLGTHETLEGFVDAEGSTPLPPYIDRPLQADDTPRYQTVYARHKGAVAAPTAGLHFDAALLETLNDRGIEQSYVTLHVGAGTFQPVRVDDIDKHRMHAERVSVGADTVAEIAATRAAGGRVIAVGTTSVRALETAAAGGELKPYKGETRLFLLPGCRFRVIDGLITNFHLPQSTLLMLVAAFAGLEHILAAYREAVAAEYRFFSFGDAMLIWPQAAFAAAALDEDMR